MAKKNTHAAEVAALTQAKFLPQTQAILMLLAQARQDRQQGIDVARSTGASVRGLAEKAQPQAAASLASALTGISSARERVPGVAPGAPGAIAAGSQRDMALAESNAQAQAQRTRDELVSRAQDAQTGAAQGVLQAQAQYAKTRGELAQQLQNLSAQQGAYAAGELARLVAADTKRAQQVADREDSQNFTAQQNATYRETPGERAAARAEKDAAARRKAASKAAAKAQQRFLKAHASLATATYEAPDPNDATKVIDRPVTKQYVKQNRAKFETELRASGLSPEMARRVVDAYVKVGGADPGSFKKYRRARKVGSAVGGVTLPAKPFG